MYVSITRFLRSLLESTNLSIVFSNTLKNVLLEELAQADEHEVVKEVQVFTSPSSPPFSLSSYFICAGIFCRLLCSEL